MDGINFNINFFNNKINKFRENKNLEFEIRFQKIDKYIFQRLLDFLFSKFIEYEYIKSTNIFYYDDNDKSKIRYCSESKKSIKKNILYQYFFKDHDFKAVLSEELPIKFDILEKTTSFIRIKDRFRFYFYNKSICIDLTIINANANVFYEVECEILNEINEITLEFLKNVLYSIDFGILKIMKNTNILYTNCFKKKIYDNFNNLFRNDYSYEYLSSLNLKENDIIYKQPLGIRKFLFFHESGIWLIFNPNEYNYISNNKVSKEFCNIILDGFIINKSKNKFHFVSLFLDNKIMNYINKEHSKYLYISNIDTNLKKKLDYETNGFIVIKNNKYYKYKVYNIDLKFNINNIHNLPYFTTYNKETEKYEIFKGSEKYPFDFSTNINDKSFNYLSNDMIIEVYPCINNGKIFLNFLRIRYDKLYPNSPELANNIWNIINDDFLK